MSSRGRTAFFCGGWIWFSLILPSSAPAEPWPEGFRLGGGAEHALVIREGGQLWGFGAGNPAALANSESYDFPEYVTNRFLPFRVGAQSDWRWIEGMGDTNGTTFAIREDGSLWAWGDNSLGQLGDGTGQNRTTPTPVGTEHSWRTVSARAGSVFAVKTDNTLWAWGFNEPGSGSLGIGRGRDSRQYLPLRIGSQADWRTVQASLGRVETYTNVETVTNDGVVIETNVVRSFAAGKGGAGIRGSGEIWGWGSTFARITNKIITVVDSNGGRRPVLVFYALGTNFHPTRVGTGTDWKQVVFSHSVFALKTNGSLWRFDSTNNTFEAFPSAGSPQHLGWSILRTGQTGQGGDATGHVVGLKTDGTLWAWGDNGSDQVDAQLGNFQDEPWQIQGLSGVPDDGWRDIGAGPRYSLALSSAGVLYTWGNLGSSTGGVQRTPAAVIPHDGKKWKSALAGSDYTLGVDEDGAIYGWGATDIPDPVRTSAVVPEPIDLGGNRTDPDWQNLGWSNAVTAYRRKVVAVDSQKALRIWGDAFGDYRPDPTTNPVVIPEDLDSSKAWWNPERYEPGRLDLGFPWKTVSGNSGTAKEGTYSSGNTLPEGFAAALRGDDNTLWVWGANEAGQLGDGTVIPKDMPRQVDRSKNWAGVESGGAHVLAWKRDGSLWGWGANSNGELGLTTNVVTISNRFSGGANSTNSTNASPRFYAGRTRTVTIALASNVHRPAPVLGKSWGVRDVSAGGSHTLVLRSNGTLWAMGANDQGQLGLGALDRPETSTNREGTNRPGTNPSNNLRRVTVTNLVTNIGYVPWRVETNIETLVDQASVFQPRRIGKQRWKSVSAGDRHSLAVRADGTLWAWGDNSRAQLGNGTLVATNRPVQVGAANRWERVFAGQDHSLALRNDGTLWAWGLNDGRLGIEAEAGESPFREVSFGERGVATLLVQGIGKDSRRIQGQGLASFYPRSNQMTFGFQLDAPGSTRTEWAGSAVYKASRRLLVFSNFSASPSSTNTNAGVASRLVCQKMESRWFQPNTFRGTGTLNGTNCRLILVFSGDADRDGIPDFADASPRGRTPALAAKLRFRTAVGEPVDYELPGLPDGTTAILSQELSDLPPGLLYTNGMISGTATREAVGVREVVVGAENAAGESYATLQIEVVPPDPALEPQGRVIWTNRQGVFRHTIRMSEPAYAGFPYLFRARNLPPGLVLERKTGKLRPTRPRFNGVPAPGLYRMPFSVSHRGGGVTNSSLVLESQPPGGRWQVGKRLRFQVSLGGKGPISFEGSLPPGVSHAGQGLLLGIPTEAGDFEVTARPRNGSPEAFTLGVDPAGGVVVSATAGEAASADGAAGGWNYPAIFASGPAASWELTAATGIKKIVPDPGRYPLLWTNVEVWIWDQAAVGLAVRLKDEETVLRRNEQARVRQAQPAAIRLARISYASGLPGVLLPANHPFWLRNASGQPVGSAVLAGEWCVDFSQDEFVQKLAERVGYLIRNGCVSGVYLSGWDEDSLWPAGSVPAKGTAGGPQLQARIKLLQALRGVLGESGLIFAEAAGGNWRITGPLFDGVHLAVTTDPPPAWPPGEGWCPDPYGLTDSHGISGWEKIRGSLIAFGQPGLLRRPGNVALELWARHDLEDLRTHEPRLAGLAMSLCLSDGAYLYARPDWWQEEGRSVVPGEHWWFPEWNVRLGRPVESRRSQPEEKGFYRRQFENGWAVYLPMNSGLKVEVEFSEEVESAATGKSGRVHKMLPGQGDLFLRKSYSGLAR